MRNRFKCTRCKKIFYLIDRPDLISKEDRKRVICNNCFWELLQVQSYAEYKSYLNR